MSYYEICECGQSFKKKSNLSLQKKCWDCSDGGRKNAVAGVQKNSLLEKEEVIARLDALEKHIQHLHDTMESLVASIIEEKVGVILPSLINAQVEQELEKKFGKIVRDTTMETIAGSHSRSLLNNSKIDILKKDMARVKTNYTKISKSLYGKESKA
jgi:ribosomal protein L29